MLKHNCGLKSGTGKDSSMAAFVIPTILSASGVIMLERRYTFGKILICDMYLLEMTNCGSPCSGVRQLLLFLATLTLVWHCCDALCEQSVCLARVTLNV